MRSSSASSERSSSRVSSFASFVNCAFWCDMVTSLTDDGSIPPRHRAAPRNVGMSRYFARESAKASRLGANAIQLNVRLGAHAHVRQLLTHEQGSSTELRDSQGFDVPSSTDWLGM